MFIFFRYSDIVINITNGGNIVKRMFKLMLALIMSASLVACSTTPETNTVEGFVAGTYEATTQGYSGGDVTVTVTTSDSKIESIEVIADEETPNIGGVAIELLVDKIIAANSTQVDTVVGATLSSKALIDGINNALVSGGMDPTTFLPTVKDEVGDVVKDAEVVVVGAGGAGMTAAITLVQQGVDVVIVEKGSIVGGNTSRATGGMNAAETKYQDEAGIEDSVQLYIDDTMAGGYNINNIDLVTTMAENSNDALIWLESINAYLPEPGRAGGASVNRAHAPVDEEGKKKPVGSYLVQQYSAQLDALGIEVIYDTEVTEILLNEDKSVAGVVGVADNGKVTVNAQAVVVATGGFGADLEYVAELNPALDGFVTTNAATITGDAIEFLGDINANFVDLDQIQIHPTVNQEDGYLISESLRGSGAILINNSGERFTDELLTRDVVSANVLAQDGSFAYLVVDQAMLDKSSTIAGYIQNGYMQEAATVADLATLMNVDVATLETTMQDWNEAVANNEDVAFGREGLDLVDSDLSTAPYYVATIAPGVHHTMGGVEINMNAEVIDVDGNVISGLYAAGEVTGGVHGGNRLGGNAVTDIVVFGLIAGENAAKYVSE